MTMRGVHQVVNVISIILSFYQHLLRYAWLPFQSSEGLDTHTPIYPMYPTVHCNRKNAIH